VLFFHPLHLESTRNGLEKKLPEENGLRTSCHCLKLHFPVFVKILSTSSQQGIQASGQILAKRIGEKGTLTKRSFKCDGSRSQNA
jgi:hypothetical protein